MKIEKAKKQGLSFKEWLFLYGDLTISEAEVLSTKKANTLRRWYKESPQFLEVIIMGCMYKKSMGKNSEVTELAEELVNLLHKKKI